MNLKGSIFGPRRLVTGEIRVFAAARSDASVLLVSSSPVGRKTKGINV